jgi:hypothetical protein
MATHALDWEGKRNTMVMMFVGRILFMLNSLTAIDGHDHQLANELLCSLVTSTIFVRC